MRLLELTLDCYGPFAGAKLTFDPQAALHIVYGPNEAGKSSALAAIGDLFYGPAERKIGFLRPADLRLGASIRARNGQVLQFFRRRGLKNVLLDATGAPLPDDALAPFLGAASREIFQRAFGLNAAELRKGGDDMLKAEGEIGASLFAAASGLRGLLDVKRELDAEADSVFGDKRAERRSFYQALDRFNAARTAEKTASISETALKSLRGEIETAGNTIAGLEEAERQAQTEKLRLNRLVKAAPILKHLARLRAELAGFEDVARFSADWARRLATLLDAARAAGEKATAAETAQAVAQDEFTRIAVDTGLIEHAEQIEALIRASGAYKDSVSHLPDRQKKWHETHRPLIAVAQQLGLTTIADLRAAAPDPAALQRAERLIARRSKREAQSEELSLGLEREENRLSVLKDQQKALPPDSAALAEKLRAFGAVESFDATLAELRLAKAAEARALAEKAARLAPALPDLDLFARSPSPDANAIAESARAFEELDARETDARRCAREAGEQVRAAREQLRKLESRGKIPALADLRAARLRRDAAWTALASAWQDAPLWAQAEAAFLAAQDDADRLADALLTDSARVAAAEAERDKIDAAERLGADAALELSLTAEARTARAADWTRAWSACGVTPAAPRDMIRWRAEADQLLPTREALRRKQDRIAADAAKLETLLPALAALAEECRLKPLALDAAAQVRRLAARIAEFARDETASRDLAAEIAAIPKRIAEQRKRLAELDGDEAQSREDWRAALALLRLDETAGCEEAQARVALWRGLPGDIDEEAERAHRVEAIGRDIAAFEADLDALLLSCARDIPARPALAARDLLSARLTEARRQAALRERAARAVSETAATATAQAERAAQAETAVAAHLAEAGAERDAAAHLDEAGAASAAALSERLRARDALAATIADAAEKLALAADGADEAGLAAEAATFDADAARVRLEEIARESRERLSARDGKVVLRAEGEAKLVQMQSGVGAEAAIQARESARAEIESQSRRWAALKLASLLVDSSLARHRQSRKDPLIARAGALFGTLTAGRYLGLDQDFGEDDHLHLRARRAVGDPLKLGELSEGTQDQLYLALRLAFLEDFAARNEAPPFVGDDLFASFDDSRVEAGLRALAEAGPLIQPILFTHHAHVAAIAQARLGAAAQIMRLD